MSRSIARIRPSLLVLLIVALAMIIPACSDDDSSEPTVSLEGAVIDGYVSGATVTLYGEGGLGAPTTIASGTTDANGNFVLNLPQSQLPDHIGLLSKGGTIIETGLPAPTMAMVALRDQDRYYITPITDSIVWQGFQPDSSFFAAETALATELGLANTELYSDPFADGALPAVKEGLYRALASGEQSSALANGNYQLSLVSLDNKSLGVPVTDIDDLLTTHQLSGDLNISDGVVTGTITGGDTVTGHVQGANLVLSINYPGGDGVTRLGGTVGLFGSLSGNYVDYDATGVSPVLSSGVFVASLIPASGVDAAGFKQAVKNVFEGNRNALFRDLYGDRDLAWAAVDNVTIDTTATNTVSSANFTLHLNAATGATDNITFQEGRLLLADDGTPTGLAVMRYQDSGGDYAYLVQALGNRRGIYVSGDTTNGHYAIGESYFSRRDALGGSAMAAAQANPNPLDLAVTNISLDMLGNPRDPSGFVTDQTITGPTLTKGAGADGSAASSGGVVVVSGSMLGLKDSSAGVDNANLDDTNDFLALAELRSTGALQGDIAEGGPFVIRNSSGSSVSVDAADWPVPVVGFVAPQDSNTSGISSGEVQLDFLARPLYTLDLSTPVPVSTSAPSPAVVSYPLASLTDYNLIIKGSIQFDGRNAATLKYQDSEGETGTLTLAVENRSGIYHFEGPMGTEYIDIFWSRGGNRAVFIASDAADGNGNVYEIGEAFMTF